MKTKILVIGATSAIAEEVCRLYAKSSNELFLVGRNAQRLASIAKDLEVRGAAKVNYEALDLNHFDKHEELIVNAEKVLGHIDILLIAHGTLSDQKACEASILNTLNELNTNFLSVISLLTIFANYFEKRRQGTIAVITSVAGDRGRQSNYVYGTAKGGLNVFLQGLRNRLAKSNVTVLTIKPGFVDTPMTKDFKKGILWRKPNTIAKKIVNAISMNKQVVYLPGFWRQIMWIIKVIPERLFSRLSL